MLWTHRSLAGLLCNPMRKMKIMWLFLLFHFNGAPVEWNWQGKTEVLGEKPVLLPLCPSQIPHGPTRDRTRTSAVRGRRLTASAMAQPLWFELISLYLSNRFTINHHQDIIGRELYNWYVSWCTMLNCFVSLKLYLCLSNKNCSCRLSMCLIEKQFSQLHCTTNFDFLSASETKYVSLYRFWDAEHENGHEKAWLAKV